MKLSNPFIKGVFNKLSEKNLYLLESEREEPSLKFKKLIFKKKTIK